MKNSSFNYFSQLSFFVFVMLFSSELISSEIDGGEVYKRMVDVYGQINEYSDIGVIKVKRPGGRYEEEMNFATRYNSNGSFSFEWSNIGGAFNGDLNYIKNENNEIKILFRKKPFKKKSLTSALQSFVGVTHSSSYFVTRYLVPEVPAIKLSGVFHINLDEVFNNNKEHKYLLNIEYMHGGVEKIWLNSEYLIVKRERQIKGLDGVVFSTEISITPKAKLRTN